MKIFKLLLTTLFIIITSSCTKETKQENKNLDSIIGSWQPVKIFTKFKDGSNETIEFNACIQKSRYIFKEDLSIELITYDYEDGIGNNCTTEYSPLSKFLRGTWENLGENLYKSVHTHLDYGNGEEYTETDILNITFPDSQTLNETYDQFNDSSNEEYTIIVYTRIE